MGQTSEAELILFNKGIAESKLKLCFLQDLTLFSAAQRKFEDTHQF